MSVPARPVLFVLCCLSLGLALQAPLLRANDLLLQRSQHAWGRFPQDSWKCVRVVTETFDKQGRTDSTTITETRTTLADVGPSALSLRSEIAVEVAGKRFVPQPQLVKQGYCGESEGQVAEIKEIGTSQLVIGGETIPCEIRQVSIRGGDVLINSTVHFSASVAPYVLQRETVSSDAAGKFVHYQTRVDVLALGMPCRVLAEVKPAAYVRTIHTNPAGTTSTVEVHCLDVPGGIVAHASKELDAGGRLVRRSTLELVNYGVGEPEAAAGLNWQRRRILLRRPLPADR